MKYIENILVVYPNDYFFSNIFRKYIIRGDGEKRMHDACAVIEIDGNGYKIIKKLL